MKSATARKFSPASDLKTSFDVDALEEKFLNKQATVGIIGLGYVGIPLAAALVKNGSNVIGFDIDTNRVDMLNQGKSPIKHAAGDELERIFAASDFTATTDFADLAKVDAILICVPTPLTKQREPDMYYVVETTKTIGKYLRKGQIIALESTTYPGTTTEVMQPMLEEMSGLKAGVDFLMAYSPEREDPGNADFSAASTPKVVGGNGKDALRVACALYGTFVPKVVPVSSTETAEAVKLTENIFRAVNIALVNELKVIYAAMGIDVWEVIDAAKTKPFGFMPFYPGPGLGGHCIPIDPFYLTWKAREFEISTRFIELAGEINTAMPKHVISELVMALNERFSKSLKGSKILVMGLAYKKNVDDIRESPSLKIIEIMESMGAEVFFYDPLVPVIPRLREHPTLIDRESVKYEPSVLKGFDAAMITTDHDDLDYQVLVDNCPLVMDCRNVIERKGIKADNVMKA
jgi:UDP-N-acetyl-D-glucosamine dehydrogenase